MAIDRIYSWLKARVLEGWPLAPAPMIDSSGQVERSLAPRVQLRRRLGRIDVVVTVPLVASDAMPQMIEHAHRLATGWRQLAKDHAFSCLCNPCVSERTVLGPRSPRSQRKPDGISS